MRGVNRVAGYVALFLSLVALFTVLNGFRHLNEPRPTDEGIGAHIFQLSIMFLAPTILLFLMTADWTRPLRGVRPLAIPAVAVVLAFCALYYLEHSG